MIRKIVFGLTALAGLAMVAAPGADAESRILIPGNVAAQNINRVNANVRWHSNYNAALDEARRTNKMVFWVHLVGDMEGAT